MLGLKLNYVRKRGQVNLLWANVFQVMCILIKDLQEPEPLCNMKTIFRGIGISIMKINGHETILSLYLYTDKTVFLLKRIPVDYFAKEANPRLAKRPLETNGRLVNLVLLSLIKEATGVSCLHVIV